MVVQSAIFIIIFMMMMTCQAAGAGTPEAYLLLIRLA